MACPINFVRILARCYRDRDELDLHFDDADKASLSSALNKKTRARVKRGSIFFTSGVFVFIHLG
jgi:hypothetical protein